MGYKLAMFLGLTGLLMVLVVDQADAIRQKRMVEASIDSLMYLSKDPTVLPIEEDEVTFAPTASGEEGEGGHEHASGEEHYAGDGHGHGSSDHDSDEEHYAGDGHGHGSSVEDPLLRQEEEERHEHDSDEEHYAGDGHGHGSSVEDLESRILDEAIGLLELLSAGKRQDYRTKDFGN
ncbi:hypothetical protein Bbelb_203460 [Branchiostoma belcheri]|nr:hypothetical protein Bbelb_203460 [Branchiostoma belcheri]